MKNSTAWILTAIALVVMMAGLLTTGAWAFTNDRSSGFFVAALAVFMGGFFGATAWIESKV